MPKPTDYLDTWEHGFIRVDQKGRRTYWIREMRDGKRLKASTRCHTREGALAVYAEWSKNPADWKPNAVSLVVRPQSILLTQDLVDEFLEWSETKGARGKGNSKGHVADQRVGANFWLEKLGGSDLRTLKLEEIHAALKGVSGQVGRRKMLKTFYAWLRSEDGGNRLKLAEDPVSRMLKVPKVERSVPDKAIPWVDLLKVKNALTGHSKAVFIVQLATGWHITELVRFGRSGRIDAYVGPQKAAGVLVCPLHKVGGEHRTAVDAEAVEAAKMMLAYRPRALLSAEQVVEIQSSGQANTTLAKRFSVSEAAIRKARNATPQATGMFSAKIYSKEVAEVAKKLKLNLTAGQLRHSIATKMVNDGADIGLVSTFLGHRSLATTKRFYATHTVPINPALQGGR